MADLGTLFVAIDATTKDFDKKINQSEKKTISFTKTLGNISKVATATFLGVGAAAIKLTKEVGQQADRLLDLEQITGLSTKTLQEFQNVATVAGVSFDGLTGIVQKFTSRLPTIESGTSETAKAFNQLGVDLKGANGEIRSAEDLVPELITSLQGIENVTERNAIAQQVFGRSLGDLAPVLGLTAEETQKARDEANELGLVWEREAIVKANEFRIQTEKLTQRFRQQGVELGSSLIPIIEKLIPVIDGVLDDFTNLIENLDDVDGSTIALVTTIGGLVIALPKATTAVNGLKVAFTTLNSPIGAVGIAIAGIIAGLNKLKEINAEKAQKTFGDLEEVTGRTAVELKEIADKSATLFAQYRSGGAKAIPEAFSQIVSLTGLTSQQLIRVLELTDSLTDAEKAYLEQIKQTSVVIDDQNDLQNTRNSGLDTQIEKTNELSAEQLQAYIDQNARVQEILDSNKSEIELIDEQIESITKLKLADSTFRDDQQEALELLQARKQELLDEEVEANKKAQQEIIDEALKNADKSLEIVEERDAEIDEARSEDLRKVEESQQKQVQYYQDAANSIIEIASNISSEKVRILEDELDEELEIIKETEKEDIKANENKLETALSTIKKELEANETLTDELEEENKQRIQDKKDANDEELADALRLIEETLSLKTDALKAESDGEVALKEFKQKLAEEELAQDIADTEAEIERLLATGEIEDEERARRLQAELENDAQLRELEEVAEAERLARIEAIRTAEQEAETARITAAEEAKAKQDDLNAELLQATTDFENERVTLAQDAEASRIKAQEDAQSESDRIEQERADEEKRIKEDLANKLYDIELEQFRLEKAAAIIQAGINTALAVTSLGVVTPAAIAAGVAGAAQVAFIASQPEPPIPAFAEGGAVKGARVAVVGEDRGEVMFGMGAKGAPMFQEFIDRTVAGLKNGGQTIVNINSLYPPRRQDLERLARDLYNPQIKEQQRRGVNG